MKKWNKKGIMIKFVVTIILAILIFVPACYVASSFFRLSEQAGESYGKFVEQILLLEKANPGDKKIIMTILDEGTAIVYFEEGSNEVKVSVDARVPYTDYSIILKKPSYCDQEKGCLCLFREPEFDTTWWKPGYNTITVTSTVAQCQEFKIPMAVDTCSKGKANAVNSYNCVGGFMLERHLADKSSWATASYYEMPRRAQLKVVKEGGALMFS